MVKTIAVGVLNSSDNIERTRNVSPVKTDSKSEANSLRTINLLTGFCIGQAIMVAAIATVLAMFVNSNTKEIATLKAEISQLARVGQDPLSDSYQSGATETSIEALETKVQDHDTRITQLQIEDAVVKDLLKNLNQKSSSEIVDLQRARNTTFGILLSIEDEIKVLEKDKHVYQEQSIYLNNTITELESCISKNEVSILTLKTKIVELEMELTHSNANTKSVNGSITNLEDIIMDHFRRLELNVTKLEDERVLDRIKIQDLNATIVSLDDIRVNEQAVIQTLNASTFELEASALRTHAEIQNLNTNITMLVAAKLRDHAKIQNLKANISKLEICQTQDQVKIQTMNVSIASLEYLSTLDRDIIALHNSTIVQIQKNLTRYAESLYNNTLLVQHLDEDTEINADSIRNLSSKVQLLNANTTTCMAMIDAYNKRLLQLHLSVNITQDLQQGIEARLAYLEGRQVGFTVTDPEPTSSGLFWYPNFGKVVTNTGDAYNITTGEFRCDYPGLYLFSLAIARNSGVYDSMACGFDINHVPTDVYANAYGRNTDYPFAANSLVTYLDSGDTVHIDCFNAQEMTYATFSGVLIRPKYMYTT